MAALLESLPDRYQPFKVFRMNRDVRFSATSRRTRSTGALEHGRKS